MSARWRGCGCNYDISNYPPQYFTCLLLILIAQVTAGVLIYFQRDRVRPQPLYTVFSLFCFFISLPSFLNCLLLFCLFQFSFTLLHPPLMSSPSHWYSWVLLGICAFLPITAVTSCVWVSAKPIREPTASCDETQLHRSSGKWQDVVFWPTWHEMLMESAFGQVNWRRCVATVEEVARRLLNWMFPL